MSLEMVREGLSEKEVSEKAMQTPEGRTFQAEQNCAAAGWDTLGMLRKSKVASVPRKLCATGDHLGSRWAKYTQAGQV